MKQNQKSTTFDKVNVEYSSKQILHQLLFQLTQNKKVKKLKQNKNHGTNFYVYVFSKISNIN